MTLDQGVGKAALIFQRADGQMFSGEELSLGLWFNFGVGDGQGGSSGPPGQSRAGALPCAAPGGRLGSVLESSPALVRWQRAGVTSETPVGLS